MPGTFANLNSHKYCFPFCYQCTVFSFRCWLQTVTAWSESELSVFLLHTSQHLLNTEKDRTLLTLASWYVVCVKRQDERVPVEQRTLSVCLYEGCPKLFELRSGSACRSGCRTEPQRLEVKGWVSLHANSNWRDETTFSYSTVLHNAMQLYYLEKDFLQMFHLDFSSIVRSRYERIFFTLVHCDAHRSGSYGIWQLLKEKQRHWQKS